MQAKIFVSDISETRRNATIIGDMEQTRQCIRCFAEQELALRRQRLERAEAKDAHELELRRRLDQDRKAVREQLTREASRSFESRHVGISEKNEGSRSVNTEVPKSGRGPQQPQDGTLGLKVAPASAFNDHPYRLYFNWPALREDHVTGRAG